MTTALPRLAILPLLALLMLGNGPMTYVVDATASSVTAKVGFFGVASKTAGFPKIKGDVTIVPDKPNEALVDVTIDATALTAPDNVTLERLRGDKFFWVDKYPVVRFVGRRLVMKDDLSGTVEGELTARGVTRSESLAVTFDTAPEAAAEGQAVTLKGEMEIDRRDYGMTAYSLIVGKKVTIRMTARMIPS